MTATLAFRLTHPKFHADKVYLVRVKGEITPAKKSKLESGVVIEGPSSSRTLGPHAGHSRELAVARKTAPCRIMGVKYNGTETEFKITLNEGRKRQIRMMARSIGHHVTYLCRLSMGKLQLGSLPKGQWRLLTQQEVGLLKV